MASYFSITDGIDTYLLNSTASVNSSFSIENYPMQTPQPAVTRAGVDGGDQALTPWQYQNVSESMTLLVQNSPDEARVALRELETALERARWRQNSGMGPRVYLQRTLDSDQGDVWRSEILSGRLSYSDLPDDLQRGKIFVTLNITRRYFWEGIEQAVAIATSEDSPATTSAVDAYNNDDATSAATNWMTLVWVSGVLPTPVKLRIQNDSGESLSWREFYLTNTAFSDAANFDPFLLGSEASGGATFAWSTTTEDVAWRWTPTTLTDARLTDLAGRYYRVLAAFDSGAETDVYLRATVEVYVSGLPVTQYVGGRVYYNGEGIADLGVVPIPPGGYDTLGSDVSLKISVQNPAGGSSSMTLDFVQLTPVGDGLFQRIVQASFAAPDGAAVVFDGMENQYYHDDAGAHRAILRARGNPILLFPGLTNRLRLLFREADGFHAGRRFEATAWARARRLSI